MRGFSILSLALALAVPVAAAPPAHPLLGEWQAEGTAPPGLLSFRRILFAPSAMILDDRQAVAIAGYDVADGATRVRTAQGGDLLFIVEPGRICLAEVDGAMPLLSRPPVKAGGRCFTRS